jgi:LysR family glycine cleavage system transcriptional activator
MTYADWQIWLNFQNAFQTVANRGILFDDVQTMLAAAQAGQGVCLGDRLTCDTAIRTGALIRPFDAEILSDKAYVLTTGKTGKSASSSAFENWLRDQL